jgi:protocatechuate 3,4-dioxygenase beta subunit
MEAMGTVNTERVAGVVNDALAALHEVLERHRVTEAEWHAVLAFLTSVGRADEFILLSDVTRTSVLIDTMEHGGDDSGATASDVEGPLYVDDPPWREKPVRVYEDYQGMGDDADVLLVRGSVTATDGKPLPDAVIDIWQTGPNGGYDIWDERQPEYNFRGRWRVEDEGGAYEFQTMLPQPYTVPVDGPVGRYLEAVGQHPWRPAHIHFKVTAPGHHPLVTQVFFPGDPYLENDTIGAVKPALVLPVQPEGDHLLCPFDIVLRPAA